MGEGEVLTTPGDNTKINGMLHVESSTTCAMFNTGGSVNLKHKETSLIPA